MSIKELLPREILIPVKVGLWWKRNEIGKWLLSKQHRQERRARKRRLRELGIEEDLQMATYNKLWVMLAGGLLALLSRWFPVFEAADAQAVVEAIVLLLTALGVWAAPNKPAAPKVPKVECAPLTVVLALVLTVMVLSATVAQAEERTLTITPASMRTDGRALPLSEIQAHYIECAMNGGEYSELDTIRMPLLAEVYDFAPGEWQCRGYTIDNIGNFSPTSTPTMVFTALPALPKAPAAIEIS